MWMSTGELGVEGLKNSVGRGSSQDGWDSGNWNGDTIVFRERLSSMQICQDVHRHLCIILVQAHPVQYAELLVFLVNSASTISHETRKQLIEADITDTNNAETSELVEHYQISREMCRQWQGISKKAKLLAQDQLLVFGPREECVRP